MRLGLVTFLMALPGAALAQQWEPGEGCEPFLTVQGESCSATNFWTCADAPEGYVYRAHHEFGEPVIADIYDAERNWIATEFSDGWREVLLQPATDLISISGLAETGFDTLDFEMLSNPSSPGDAVTRVRARGADVMLGETVEIDGETLELSQYMVTFATSDGVVYGVNAGKQYYSPRWKFLLSGVYTWTEGDTVTEYDNTPVAFIEPGEPGFGATQGEYGCDADGDGKGAETPPKTETAKEADGAKSE